MRPRLMIRFLPILSVLLSGCSTFGGTSQSAYSYGPERIYLGSYEVVQLGRFDDRDRYACLNGPLMCQSFGISFDCRCN